jgi:hypothetical protein
MDLNVLNSWLLAAATLAAGAIGWLFRAAYARISANERATAALALHVAEEYVSVKRFETYSIRFDEVAKVIFEKLDDVRDRLDKKADKQ